MSPTTYWIGIKGYRVLEHTAKLPLRLVAEPQETPRYCVHCASRITEGFHRKMKLIQRRAYGFRNFNNYRLRVIAQCG